MYIYSTILVSALASLSTASPVVPRQLLGGGSGGGFLSGLMGGGDSSGSSSGSGSNSGGLGGLLGGSGGGSLLGGGRTFISSSEFSRGGCKPIMFAWARGSTEMGNMGTVIGPPLSNGLKKEFGADKVATEGVAYAALIGTNVMPGGTDPASKRMMANTLSDMASKCPDSVLVAGGYSQGAAVCHRAIEGLDDSVKEKIAGVVLYGDTQKKQDNDQIPNFPKDKVKIICQPGDAVCRGLLVVLPAHLTYGMRSEEGISFLVQQIKGVQKKMKMKREAKEKERRSIEGVESAEGAEKREAKEKERRSIEGVESAEGAEKREVEIRDLAEHRVVAEMVDHDQGLAEVAEVAAMADEVELDA